MSTISVRLDSKDKHLFEEFCKDVGMSISTAVSMFVKNVIANQKLPFSVERDPFYSKENIERLESAVVNAKSGKNMHYHDLIEDQYSVHIDEKNRIVFKINNVNGQD